MPQPRTARAGPATAPGRVPGRALSTRPRVRGNDAGMAAPVIRALDHFVLTVASIEASSAFYSRALGFGVETFGPDKRTALTFGAQKINLHEAGREFTPRARAATPGSGDFCLLSDTPVEEVAAHLGSIGVAIEEGPVRRTGATGPLVSVYFRDPDGNLVEVSNPL